jgi:NAD(P)H-flavin reductase
VTELFPGIAFDSVAACGPGQMLRAVYDAADVPGQFSFEARMACGVGACMGCTCVTNFGPSASARTARSSEGRKSCGHACEPERVDA